MLAGPGRAGGRVVSHTQDSLGLPCPAAAQGAQPHLSPQPSVITTGDNLPSADEVRGGRTDFRSNGSCVNGVRGSQAGAHL